MFVCDYIVLLRDLRTPITQETRVSCRLCPYHVHGVRIRYSEVTYSAANSAYSDDEYTHNVCCLMCLAATTLILSLRWHDREGLSLGDQRCLGQFLRDFDEKVAYVERGFG